MKALVVAILAVSLSGCAQIKMMLVKHDPSLANAYVQTQVAIEKVNCDKKDTFQAALDASYVMSKYAEFRNDPMKDSAVAVNTNLKKAVDSQSTACTRWVNLANQRMNVLKKSWGDR